MTTDLLFIRGKGHSSEGQARVRAWKEAQRSVMTEKNKERDIKTRYEFLIAGIVVVLLCILAFVAFKITGYLNGARASGTGETTLEASDGTVLIEVAIRETTNPEETVEETEVTEPEEVPVEEIINEHDDIRIFTATTPGENYYKSKEGRLKLYADPMETDEDRPSLMEEAAFEVLGFSRDGWAAISYGGQRYYVKSAEIIPADAPEDWEERHKEAEDSQAVRFFTPVSGNIEYVVTMDTKAFSLPDVMSSGLSTDLKAGERVIVVATDGEWYKIIYMNAEYYVLSYLEPREAYIEEHPEEEIIDNTGYAPAGSSDAAASASSAGAADTANSGGTTTDGDTGSGSSDDSGSSGDSGYSAGYGSAVYELLDYVNSEREAAGLEPLTWSGELENCACIRAAELPLLTNDQNANHQRPNGDPWYTVNEGAMWAENIAYGQRSVSEVHYAWVGSSGHYANMMNPEYRTFGAALYTTDDGYGYYWIEEFGY